MSLRLGDEVVSSGVTERPLRVDCGHGEVPGILWRPEAASGPTGLIAIGHGGTQHKRSPNVLGLARRFVRHLGVSVVSLDAPSHGERVVDAELAARQRAGLARRLSEPAPAGALEGRVSEQARHVLETLDQAVAEWRAVLDALESRGLARRPFGYWGLSMGAMIGLPLVAAEQRIAAAVLGLVGASVAGLPGAEARRAAAAQVRVPVLFVLQLDDQLVARDSGLALFDALGSADKVLHAFPGGHVDTPMSERDAYDDFFARNLAPSAH